MTVASVQGVFATGRATGSARIDGGGVRSRRGGGAGFEGGAPDVARPARSLSDELSTYAVGLVTISALSKATGASQRALRFYEAIGLLQPLRSGGRKRLYSPAQCALAQEIALLRRLDLPVEEIRPLIDRQQPDGERAEQLRRTLTQLATALEAKARCARAAIARVEPVASARQASERGCAEVPGAPDEARGLAGKSIGLLPGGVSG